MGNKPERSTSVLLAVHIVTREDERFRNKLAIRNVAFHAIEKYAIFVLRHVSSRYKRLFLQAALRKGLREDCSSVIRDKLTNNSGLDKRVHSGEEGSRGEISLVGQNRTGSACKPGNGQGARRERAVPPTNLRRQTILADIALVKRYVVITWNAS